MTSLNKIDLDGTGQPMTYAIAVVSSGTSNYDPLRNLTPPAIAYLTRTFDTVVEMGYDPIAAYTPLQEDVPLPSSSSSQSSKE